jgi:hypothetical protein
MAEQFSEIERNAMAGDIRAQRQLADCYLNGCPALPSPDPALACAWRIVIIASGDPQITASDVEARKAACGSLQAEQQRRATAEAKAVVVKLYGRELVLPADFFAGPKRAPSR